MRQIFILFSILIGLNLYGQIENLELPNEKFDTILNIERIGHFSYVCGYIEEFEQSAWVAYNLTKEDTLITCTKRFSFKEDSEVSTKSANASDYKKSGYDRGHLLPAADMRKNYASCRETYFYTNCSPQLPGFNRGKWKSLESWTRDLLKCYEKLYIVTGPVLTKGLPTIGDNKVAVPNFFYKAIIMYDGSEYFAVAFLMPNKKINRPLSNYVVSIDLIEALTEIDFFSKLPDKIENDIESYQNQEIWVNLK